MINYHDWNIHKLYSDHLDRLTNIKNKKFKKPIHKNQNYAFHSNNPQIINNINLTIQQKNNTIRETTPNIKSQRNNHLNKNSNIYTNIHLKRKQTLNSIKNNQTLKFVPLPLVSQRQRKLLGDAIKRKDLSLQQRQMILENYLLGKRILQTEAVVKSKQLKKQYKFHIKVSKNMSRSLKTNRAFTQMRDQRFRQYSRDQAKRDHFSSKKQSKGNGSYQLELNIRQILLIKGKLDANSNQEVLYNIFLTTKHHNKSEFKTITLQQMLNETLRFNFKKKDLVSCDFIEEQNKIFMERSASFNKSNFNLKQKQFEQIPSQKLHNQFDTLSSQQKKSRKTYLELNVESFRKNELTPIGIFYINIEKILNENKTFQTDKKNQIKIDQQEKQQLGEQKKIKLNPFETIIESLYKEIVINLNPLKSLKKTIGSIQLAFKIRKRHFRMKTISHDNEISNSKSFQGQKQLNKKRKIIEQFKNNPQSSLQQNNNNNKVVLQQ